MTLLTISTKGWVVIPAPLREKYNLKPGGQVNVVDYGGVLSLLPVFDDPVAQTAGMLKGRKSLTRALVTERAKVRAHERKR